MVAEGKADIGIQSEDDCIRSLLIVKHSMWLTKKSYKETYKTRILLLCLLPNMKNPLSGVGVGGWQPVFFVHSVSLCSTLYSACSVR